MRYLILIFFICFPILSDETHAQTPNKLHISGYLQGMPVWIHADLPEPFEGSSFWEYRIQNRLNLRYDFSSNLTVNWQMRTRFFAGDLVTDIPGYSDVIDRDEGIVNLSWMVTEQDNWFLHYIPDRLNIDWQSDDWRITVGRQRINWGINTATNPNDLFNIYSFYEFGYPERPGSDAIRIQHFLDWASRVEVAWRPARDLRNSVAAAMYLFNRNGYDVQLISGYYRNRLALGGGWAGSIAQTGFKGEAMLFSDLEERSGNSLETNLIVAISMDHMFDNSLFITLEGLYNLAGGRDEFMLLGEPLTADNPSFSKFQFLGLGSYPFSPLWNGSLSAIWYPDERALFLSPSVNWNVAQNIDLNLLAQLFAGSNDSVFANAGNVVAASITWNF